MQPSVGFAGRLHALVLDQLVDDDAAGDVAGDDHREAGGDQADAAEQDRHPAFAAGEVDGNAEDDEGEEREQQGQTLDRDRDVLRRLQLVGLEDLDLGSVGRQFLRQVFADPHLLGKVREQAAEVELDVPIFGFDRFFLVFEDGEKLFVGGPVRLFPEFLGGRGFERLFGALTRDLAQATGRGAGQVLGVAGQDFFQFLAHVDVFVELVDQVIAEGRADRLVLEEAPAGVDPVVGVERLALGPDRENAEEGEDGAEDHEPSY